MNFKGRLMFDTLIYYFPHANNLQDDQRFLLEVDSNKKEDILKYLKIYRVKRKVQLTYNKLFIDKYLLNKLR